MNRLLRPICCFKGHIARILVPADENKVIVVNELLPGNHRCSRCGVPMARVSGEFLFYTEASCP